MTGSDRGGYKIRLLRTEASTTSSQQDEIKQAIGRIKKEGISVPPLQDVDTPEIGVQSRVVVEQIVDNNKINRESSELYAHLDPLGSNCPARFLTS